jgi:rhomboid protease GluP
VEGRPIEPRPRALSVPLAQPLWTYVLLGLNILAFVLTLSMPQIADAGVKDGPAIAAGEYYRLLSAIFLHVDLTHLLSNMIALYALGTQLEGPFGYRRFLTVYLLSGLAGSAFSYLLTPAPSLGASGAIYGLLGALVAFLLRNRRGLGELGRRQLGNLLAVIVLNLVISITLPFIDLWGHAGGLIAGLALGFALTPVYRLESDPFGGMPRVVDAGSPGLRLIGASVVVMGFILVTVLGTLRWTP